MIYQYIYGRNDSGYDVIKKSDNCELLNQKMILNMMDINHQKHEAIGDNEQISPMVFFHVPYENGASFVGCSSTNGRLRNETINHYYIFDGSNMNDLIENPFNIINIIKFAKNINEAKNIDVFLDDVFQEQAAPEPEVLDRFEFDAGMLESLIAACYRAAGENRIIYIICSEISQTALEDNKKLMAFIYSLLPPRMINRLGFISYYKYMNPGKNLVLSSSIKIRFVENNLVNLSDIPDEAKKGNFIFVPKDNIYPRINLSKDEIVFLDFLLLATSDLLSLVSVEEFYRYAGKHIISWEDFNLETAAMLYSIYISNGQLPQDCDLHTFINNYENLSNIIRNEYVKAALSGDDNEFCSDDMDLIYLLAYDLLPNYKEKVIDYFYRRVKDLRFEFLASSAASMEFAGDFRIALLCTEEYSDAGLIFLQESFNNLKAGNTKVHVIKTIALIKQLLSISEQIFAKVDASIFFDLNIKEQLAKADDEIFALFVNRLTECSNEINSVSTQQVIEQIISLSGVFYIEQQTDSINNDTREKIKKFYELYDLIKNNRIVVRSVEFQQLFRKYFYELVDNLLIGNGIQDLYTFINYGCYISITSEYSDFIERLRICVLNNLLDNIKSMTDEQAEMFLSWDERQLKEISNRELLYEYKQKNKINHLKSIMSDNNMEAIKTFLSKLDESDELEDDISRDEIYAQTAQWAENAFMALPVGQLDYTLLPMIFYKEPNKNILLLPKDNISPWIKVLEYIDDNQWKVSDLSGFYDSVSKEILENKVLFREYKKLDKDTKRLFGKKIIKHDKSGFFGLFKN